MAIKIACRAKAGGGEIDSPHLDELNLTLLYQGIIPKKIPGYIIPTTTN